MSVVARKTDVQIQMVHVPIREKRKWKRANHSPYNAYKQSIHSKALQVNGKTKEHLDGKLKTVLFIPCLSARNDDEN